MKNKIFIICVAVACLMFGMVGCDDDRPDTVPDSSDASEVPETPEIVPFSQAKLNARTVDENPGTCYLSPEGIDPENFEPSKVYNIWLSDPVHYRTMDSFHIAAVQVKNRGGIIYCFTPAFRPFYISAAGTEIRLRHVCGEEFTEPGLYVGLLNSGLGQSSKEITKEDVPEYNIREKDGDIFLTFTENRTDEFRTLTLTVGSVQLFPSQPVVEGQYPFAPGVNMFYFLQMPWTDDESIWEKIPEYECYL